MEKWWLLLETNFDMLNSELQRHVYNSFYRFAYKELIFMLKDHALTEDIIQEAFLKITDRHHQLLNPKSAKQWVKKIIRNQMLDTLRRKNRHEMSVEKVYKGNQIATSLEMTISVECTVEENLRNHMLHETILELKEDHRNLLLDYYMKEMSHKQIAAKLGVSNHIIAQRLVRARKKLLDQFSRKWVDENE